MKKIITLLALLLAAIMIAAGLMPWGMPGGGVFADTAQAADGRVYVAENRNFTSRIYTLQEGTVSEFYREGRFQENSQSSIIQLSADSHGVYFLRLMEATNEWILMNLKNGTAVQECRSPVPDDVVATGLAAREGMVWITGLMQDGSIVVYEYAGGEDIGLKLMTPAQWLPDVVQAEFDGSEIHAVNAHGEACRLTISGEVTYLEEPAPEQPAVMVDGAAWLQCKTGVLLGAALMWLVLALTVLITFVVSRKSERLALRLTAVGGEVLMLALAAAAAVVFAAVHKTAGLVMAVAAIKSTGIAAAVIWLAGVVLLWLVSGRMTEGITAMTRQMAEVADGNVKARNLAPGKDELNRMNQSLQELCMSLSVREYEMNATISSYNRFVPATLTRMLDRATVAEVDLGDSRRIVSNVGLFAVGNRDEVRAALGDSSFVDFINATFGVFHDCVQKNNGSMISCTLRLSCMETMFPQNAADGVRAGLDFLARVSRQNDPGIPDPQPMMILHKASFLYGVAGKRERLFPYLSSSEMEFLESLSHKFHENGARLVMTGEYLDSIKNAGFSVRYIGFVSDGGKITYKFYEVLDVYPELERKLRMGYDQRFQEAINLFYHNDFFLARNLFSTLLRVCPEDGIVRWYLFACEHCFNHAGEGEVDYRLFGIEEA